MARLGVNAEDGRCSRLYGVTSGHLSNLRIETALDPPFRFDVILSAMNHRSSSQGFTRKELLAAKAWGTNPDNIKNPDG